MTSTVAGVIRSVVKRTVGHFQLEGAGFRVRRSIGSSQLNYHNGSDPFLMLDMFDDSFEPGEAVLAPDHGHAGIMTVTFIVEGVVEHIDNKGHRGLLSSKNGMPNAQLMFAGSGIEHSEMWDPAWAQIGGRGLGFQLWVRPPQRLQYAKPSYRNVKAELEPVFEPADPQSQIGAVRTICDIDTNSLEEVPPLLFKDVHVLKGKSIDIAVPKSWTSIVAVYSGRGKVGSSNVAVGETLLLSDGDTVRFEGNPDSDEDADVLRCIVVAGAPLHEPVAMGGPVVAGSQQELRRVYESLPRGEIPGHYERYALVERARKIRADRERRAAAKRSSEL